ncbi:MAG: hypothetical protein ACFFDK_11130 [Promethearchaeota archaeon]
MNEAVAIIEIIEISKESAFFSLKKVYTKNMLQMGINLKYNGKELIEDHRNISR